MRLVPGRVVMFARHWAGSVMPLSSLGPVTELDARSVKGTGCCGREAVHRTLGYT